MPPFSVSPLKAAANIKSAGSEKFQNLRTKYASRSSDESGYDHRDMSTKAPPPPPPVLASIGEYPAPQPRFGPPPVPRRTRPTEDLPRPPATSQTVSQRIDWSSLNLEDKKVFFGWLDEFFDAKKSSAQVIQNSPAIRSVRTAARGDSDDFSTSHPPPSERDSAAEDICNFFSPNVHWDTPWYTTQSLTPPPVEQKKSCSRRHTIQWLGDTRTVTGGILFTDLSACWYTVSWVEQTANDTTKTRRKAAFMPRPAALSREELIAAHETYGETVAGFAESYEGTNKWCARGECWDLANEALKSFEQWSYVPKPVGCIGTTHGHLIYEGKAWGKDAQTQQAGRWRGGDDCIRRGDIIQWKTAVIRDGNMIYTIGNPDHTAIIVRDQQPLIAAVDNQAMRPADLGQLEVVEQSVHSPPDRKIYRLGGIETGELWIYRPVGMEAYLSFIFSEEWPKGLQPAVEA